MTKVVRVENADTSTFKVLVQVWEKSSSAGSPDILVREVALNNPCDITDSSVYITGTRYLIVKEQ